ncbi:hypothetical protein BMF94_3882 [Rhodotorula taiwanensis]|uniref:Uncharacterized protein n=1 Tax=Rhodotorula taiwanensis TaxID=741276 RepID=A0A2S5B8D6_9BASI|nr:hypothetical protein BMF94_3882 [Rhodotorula taiwanensis]
MPRALPTWAALRDSRVRKTVADNELLRNAYKYIRDNTQLDFRTRAAAMHKLNAMPSNTIPSMVVNRCKLTGRGGGRIANEFGLCRHRFKLEAEEGNLPGVSRASW